MAGLAEILVHVSIDRDQGGCEGEGFERPVKGPDVIQGGHEKPFQRKGRVIRVLGPVQEGYRVPGIALAPLHGLLSRIPRSGLERVSGTETPRKAWFSRTSLRRCDSDCCSPLQRRGPCPFHSSPPVEGSCRIFRRSTFVAVIEPELVKGRVPVQTKKNGVDLGIPAQVVGFFLDFVEVECVLLGRQWAGNQERLL
jgi:hypothetical protein